MTLSDTITIPIIVLGYLLLLLLIRNVLLKRLSNRQVILSAFIATPVHEISHALILIISGHKILAIKFFQFDPANGARGYVRYQYNRYSVKHQIGRAIAGVAPLFGGFIGGYAVIRYLFPFQRELIEAIERYLTRIVSGESSTLTSLNMLWSELTALSLSATWDWQSIGLALTTLYLCSAISLHSVPSFEDIKSTLPGFAILLGIVCAILFIFPDWIDSFTHCAGFSAQIILSLTILCMALSTIHVCLMGTLALFASRALWTRLVLSREGQADSR